MLELVGAVGIPAVGQVRTKRLAGLHAIQRHRVVERAALQETLRDRAVGRPGAVVDYLDLDRCVGRAQGGGDPSASV